MKCPAPSSRHRRSTNPKQSALGYFVSVSNDGKNFTEEMAIVIYDSACFECNTTTMTCEEVVCYNICIKSFSRRIKRMFSLEFISDVNYTSMGWK